MRSRAICPSCKAILEFDRTVLSTVKCPKCAHQGDVPDFKEIPVKSIHCPTCNVALKISENIVNKDITCPKCKQTVTVGDDDEKTESPLEPKDRLYKPGKLVLLKDGGNWLNEKKTMALMPGVNTLGRQSYNSTCNVPLPTKDTFMSKKHAMIEVIMRPDAVFAHRLSDMGSTNRTFHNEAPLERGEVINLMPGDTIRLGHTTLQFIAG